MIGFPGLRKGLDWGLGLLSRRCANDCDLRQEAIAAPSHCFYKTWVLSGLPERLANLIDGFVEPLIEIDKSVSGPQPFLQVFARYDLAPVFKQHRQDLKGLFLKPDLEAMLARGAPPQTPQSGLAQKDVGLLA